MRDSVNEHQSHLEWLEDDLLDELRALRIKLLEQGRSILDMSMLNPDLPPPRFMLDRLLEASFKPNNHRYAVSRGIRKLREAFSEKYAGSFEVKLDADQEVCVTMGTKDALLHALMVLAQPGETVLLGEPSYPAHVYAAKLAHLRVSTFKLHSDEEALLSELKVQLERQRPKVLLLNFPNNPTGQSVSRGFYERLAPSLASCDCFVLNDFVYGEMGYDGRKPVSILAVPELRERACESYSLSKAYNVPGWRVGALLGEPGTIRQLARLKSHIDYGIFLPVQIAAAAALSAKQDLVSATVKEYQERARVLGQGLIKLGWQVEAPQFGAALWARQPQKLCQIYRGSGNESCSANLAKALLEQQGVHFTPGILFGSGCDEFQRCALALSSPSIREVLERLSQFGREA